MTAGEGSEALNDGTQQGDPIVEPKDTPAPQPAKGDGEGTQPKQDANDPLAALDADTREWLKKSNLTGDPASLAKKAHEQAKLLGNAIRVPGKDAPQEEVDAFLNKLGRPDTPDKYEFAVPESLPEHLPYDAERATEFKSLAHKLGLTAKQAAAIHDWATERAVGDFNGQQAATEQRNAEIAKGETQKLEKLWGPLKGETARANLTFADRALTEAGGQEAVEEFKRVGLIGGDDKVILSAPIATLFANIGRALYKEDGVLHGDASRLANPFEDGANFNLTRAMAVIREDRNIALAFIQAAGKKPEDFGLKA